MVMTGGVVVTAVVVAAVVVDVVVAARDVVSTWGSGGTVTWTASPVPPTSSLEHPLTRTTIGKAAVKAIRA